MIYLGSCLVNDLNIWDVFEAVGFEPHAGQIPVIESGARNRVVSAGRRLGKSEIGGHELTAECLATYGMADELKASGRRREFWIVGPEYSDSEKEFRKVWNDLERLQVPLDKPGSYNDPIGGSLHISTWNGTFQIHGKSAKHPENLVGEGLSGVVMAEAAKLKERIWTKFVRPTLADFGGWALFTSTPEGRNWFYDNWLKGQDPLETEWASWRMPSWRNPHVYRQRTVDADVKRFQELKAKGDLAEALRLVGRGTLEIDDEVISLIRDLTPEAFNQEIGADFSEFVGRVFARFDEEVHVTDLEYRPDWATYAAVDYGFTNPFVWLLIQVGPFDEIHVIDEYYQRGKTIPEIASELREQRLAPASVIKFYPDPASPSDSVQLSEALKIPFAQSGTGGPLNDRLNAIRRTLEVRNADQPEGHPDRKPQLLIDRKCTNMIREFSEYRYPRDIGEADANNTTEAPLKKDDHTPEALGRFLAGHWSNMDATRRTRIKKGKYR